MKEWVWVIQRDVPGWSVWDDFHSGCLDSRDFLMSWPQKKSQDFPLWLSENVRGLHRMLCLLTRRRNGATFLSWLPSLWHHSKGEKGYFLGIAKGLVRIWVMPTAGIQRCWVSGWAADQKIILSFGLCQALYWGLHMHLSQLIHRPTLWDLYIMIVFILHRGY